MDDREEIELKEMIESFINYKPKPEDNEIILNGQGLALYLFGDSSIECG